MKFRIGHIIEISAIVALIFIFFSCGMEGYDLNDYDNDSDGVPYSELGGTISSGDETAVAEGSDETVKAEPPLIPTVFSAYCQGDKMMNLYWEFEADDILGSVVERFDPDANEWSVVVEINGTGHYFREEGLSPSTTYYYRVKVYNETGDSDWLGASGKTADPKVIPVPEEEYYPHEAFMSEF